LNDSAANTFGPSLSSGECPAQEVPRVLSQQPKQSEGSGQRPLSCGPSPGATRSGEMGPELPEFRIGRRILGVAEILKPQYRPRWVAFKVKKCNNPTRRSRCSQQPRDNRGNGHPLGKLTSWVRQIPAMICFAENPIGRLLKSGSWDRPPPASAHGTARRLPGTLRWASQSALVRLPACRKAADQNYLRDSEANLLAACTGALVRASSGNTSVDDARLAHVRSAALA